MREQAMQEQVVLASDIIRRRQACELCKIIAYHIEKQDVGLDTSIRILTAPFCDTIDKKHKVRDTVRLKVYEVKDSVDTIVGPLQPYQIAAMEEKESRCILELQECCDPVPTTSDEHEQNRKYPSENTDTRF